MLDSIKRVVDDNFQKDSAPALFVQHSPTAAVQNSQLHFS